LSLTNALTVEHLIKDYGRVRAVDDVSFAVRPGEIFGLLGPNGAGKTSIISIIVTLQEATSGKVEVFGYDVAKKPRQAKAQVGCVPQEIINHGFFSVEEVLHFISGFFGRRKNRERIDFLLKRLALWDHKHKKVRELSGGMRRRLMIAKALVHEPKLLLLDEPTAGVDIELRSSLWEFVQELRNEGVSILLTTHYLEEAEVLCDRVAIMHGGQLKKVGPTRELVNALTQRSVRLLLRREISPVSHPCLMIQTANMVEFRLPPTSGVGGLLSDLRLDPSVLQDIQIVEGDLEDAFRSILGGKK
jgi:ABC-2 type transport system ATP-binding protein